MCPNLFVDCSVGCGFFAVGQGQVWHKLVSMTILVARAEARAEGVQFLASLLDAEPGDRSGRRGKLVETCARQGERLDRRCGFPNTFGECGCIAATAQGGIEQGDMSRTRILYPNIVVINVICDRRQQVASRIDANYHSPVPPVVRHR